MEEEKKDMMKPYNLNQNQLPICDSTDWLTADSAEPLSIP